MRTREHLGNEAGNLARGAHGRLLLIVLPIFALLALPCAGLAFSHQNFGNRNGGGGGRYNQQHSMENRSTGQGGQNSQDRPEYRPGAARYASGAARYSGEHSFSGGASQRPYSGTRFAYQSTAQRGTAGSQSAYQQGAQRYRNLQSPSVQPRSPYNPGARPGVGYDSQRAYPGNASPYRQGAQRYQDLNRSYQDRSGSPLSHPGNGWNGSAYRPEYQSSQPHLGQWLEGHQSMSSEQRQSALRSEPGFNRLAPQTQQRLEQHLGQIDRMSPAQRERTLGRIEAFERLSPDMRQQVRESAQQIQSLAPDRRRAVSRAFHDLRGYPPEERRSALASPEFQNRFSSRERGMLNNVLSIEPYEPASAADKK